jgi:hypothetical protein
MTQSGPHGGTEGCEETEGSRVALAHDFGVLVFCPVQGMGHTFSGGERPSFCRKPDSAICQAWINEVAALNGDVGKQQIWEFLSRHRLP